MHNPRILLVEDEADVLALNKKHLCAQGYEVQCAQTLAAARALVWERPPDLIVLDVLMPDGSGYDFCREIRQVTSAPILYLTCMDKEEDIVLGLQEGGDDYLTKPYSLNELSARVMARLRRCGYANAGRIELPPLTVDLLSGKAELDGMALSLSQKELQLLSYLMLHTGRSLTTQELNEAVWGDERIDIRTVYVQISKLRKKLRMGDNCPLELRSLGNGCYTLLKVRYAQPV